MQTRQSPRGRRVALLVGATGLTGSLLLPMLLRSRTWSRVHVLARRTLSLQHPKLQAHVVDFDALAALPLPAIDDVFVCLGTTIKVAGSRQAFRRVDLDYVVDSARLARERGATRLAVVSAMGASARSPVFYNRVKGEMEAALATLGYASVTIVRPSFLDGERPDSRPGERLALALARPLAPLIPKRYRAIPAAAVARAMLQFVEEGADGVRVVESDRLQAFA